MRASSTPITVFSPVLYTRQWCSCSRSHGCTQHSAIGGALARHAWFTRQSPNQNAGAPVCVAVYSMRQLEASRASAPLAVDAHGSAYYVVIMGCASYARPARQRASAPARRRTVDNHRLAHSRHSRSTRMGYARSARWCGVCARHPGARVRVGRVRKTHVQCRPVIYVCAIDVLYMIHAWAHVKQNVAHGPLSSVYRALAVVSAVTVCTMFMFICVNACILVVHIRIDMYMYCGGSLGVHTA